MKNTKYCIELRNETQKENFQCNKCNKVFTTNQAKQLHEKNCVSSLVEDNNKLELRLLKKRLEDKDDIIKELKEINKDKEKDIITSKIVDNIINSNRVIKPISKKSLVLNDITIIARAEDGFINATELCKAGGKEFSNWLKNKNSETYLQVLSLSLLIRRGELINYEKGSNEKRGTWVHPQVAINIAQWISPQFDVQVSKWVFELALTGSVELGNIINSNRVIKPISKKSLVLNDITIIARAEDGFINATELCKAGGKEFKHWNSLESTKNLLKALESEVKIPTSQLIDIKKGNSSNYSQGSWIHPDLAVQLAQWISPEFAIKVSKWIRELMLTGSVELGNEKSNYELDAIYNDKLNNLNKELEFKTNKLKKYETTIFNRTTDICPIEYYSKDVVYFFKFEIPLHLQSKYISEYPNIDNIEYICIEFGVSSNFEQRIKAHKSDKTKDGSILLHVIEMDKRYTASKMESYIKTIAKQMNIKFDYEKKLECVLVNEEEFNILINKINTGLNTLEEYDTEIKETDIKDIREPCLIQSLEIELRKLDIQVEMKKIEADADKINKKIESVTDLFKNKIISFAEYKEMIASF